MKVIRLAMVAFVLIGSGGYAQAKTAIPERKPASINAALMESYLKTADLLSQARNQGNVCEEDAYQADILSLLMKVRYSQGFKPEMITANMRQALKGTIAIKEITGEVDLENNYGTDELEKALDGAYFEAPGAGAYGPARTFVLSKEKGVNVVEMRAGYFDDQDNHRVAVKKGTWGVDVRTRKRTILSRLWIKVGNKTTVYRIEKSYSNDNNGYLLKGAPRNLDSSSGGAIRYYNGVVSECDA